MKRVVLAGTGLYAPPTVQDAALVGALCGRSEQWVLSRTGVALRHVAAGMSQVAMGAHAARQALGQGGPPDLLLNASGIPQQVLPDNGAFLAGELGLDGVPAFTVHATCLSFLVATHQVFAMVNAGMAERVLVVSAEITSLARNFKEPESATLVGDGAGAALYCAEGRAPGLSLELLGYEMQTWPEGASLTEVRGGGTRAHPNAAETVPEDNLFHMDGPKVFRAARMKAASLFERVHAKAGLRPDQVDVVVPHQASGPALMAVPRYGYREEAVVNVVGQYGNCVAASLPMALHHAVQEGRLKPGGTVALLGTGAGLSVAAMLLRVHAQS